MLSTAAGIDGDQAVKPSGNDGDERPKKRQRGGGQDWVKSVTFQSVEEYRKEWESKEDHNKIRRQECKDGTVKVVFGCKFGRKAGWARCPWQACAEFRAGDAKVDLWRNSKDHVHQRADGEQRRKQGIPPEVKCIVMQAVEEGLKPGQIKHKLQRENLPLPRDSQIRNLSAYQKRKKKAEGSKRMNIVESQTQ
eukprot:evm.model.scf_999.2 EVM.evm.TU.scf_999.2   scf_999:8757-9335(+)